MHTSRLEQTLPELAEYLSPFRVHLGHSEARQVLGRYLTESLKRNCDTIGRIVPGTPEQRLQDLLLDIGLG